MTRGWAYSVVLLLVLAVGLLLGRRGLREPESFPTASPDLPHPLLQAAALLTNAPLDMDDAEVLTHFTETNSDVFSRAVQALVVTNPVPVVASEAWFQEHYGVDLPRLKLLNHAMIARARHDHLRGNTDEAFRRYVEAYRLAERTGAGGLSPDYLVGISCRALVLQYLQPLIPNLDAEQRDEFLRLIERSEREREDPTVVVERSRRWYRQVHGPGNPLKGWADRLSRVWTERSLRPLRSKRRQLEEADRHYRERWEGPLIAQLRKPASANPRTTTPTEAENRSGSQP